MSTSYTYPILVSTFAGKERYAKPLAQILADRRSPLSSATAWRAHGIALILQMSKVRPRVVNLLTPCYTGDDDLSPRMVKHFLYSSFSSDSWPSLRQMQGQEVPEEWRPPPQLLASILHIRAVNWPYSWFCISCLKIHPKGILKEA